MSSTPLQQQQQQQQKRPSGTRLQKVVDPYPHLSSPKQAINVRAIMERAKADLEHLLSRVPGDKVLVLDEQIIGPLGHIADSSFLREHGVQKIYRLNDRPFDTPIRNVVYIVRPKIHLMKWIAVQVRHMLQTCAEQQEQQRAQKKKKKKKKMMRWGMGKRSSEQEEGEESGDHDAEDDLDEFDKRFYVFLVPRVTLICRRVLHELAIENDITLGEYPLDLIPFDYDVLSMELPMAFKECHLDGDLSSLYYVARSIMKLQSLYGLIPHIKGKGHMAMKVLEMILRMRRQIGPDMLSNVPEIDTLILFDRKSDLVSPMFTQLTYEGLIDELFGIKNSFLQPTFPCLPDAPPGQRPKIWLRSTDTVFNEIRDLNQQFVGTQLKKKAYKIDEQINERKNLQTVQQIKEFTMKLPQMQEDKRNLEMHINIIQYINTIIGQRPFRRMVEQQQAIIVGEDDKGTQELIEESIGNMEPITKVLRLLCLTSLVNNGIKAKTFDYYRKEILQAYGLEAMLTLNNLERVGLLKRNEGRSSWNTIRKGLDLVREDKLERGDIHSVHAGYAPLSVRLMEEAPNPRGWESMKDLLEQIPGTTFEFQQKGALATPQERKVVLCFFIGGVTFAELSAIRMLNEKYARMTEDGRPSRVYLVATTKLINGHTFLESLIEPVGEIQKKTHEYMLKKQAMEERQQDDEES